MKKKDIFKYRDISMKLINVGIVAFVLSWITMNDNRLTWILLGVAIASTVASGIIIMKYWKCPHCGKRLGMSYKELREDITVCPHCKGKLK